LRCESKKIQFYLEPSLFLIQNMLHGFVQTDSVPIQYKV
jgi:hypothetical protein